MPCRISRCGDGMAEPAGEWVRLVVPRDNTSAPFTAEQLYAALHAGTGRGQRTQLLLLGPPGDVGMWLRTEPERLAPVAAIVRATYPDVELEALEPALPADVSGLHVAAARWALAHDAAYPVKTVRAFEHSEPMAMTLGALSGAQEGECGAVSLVLSRAPASFARRSLAPAPAAAPPPLPPPRSRPRPRRRHVTVVAASGRRADRPARRVAPLTGVGRD